MNPLRGTETWTLYEVGRDPPFVEKQRIPFGGLKRDAALTLSAHLGDVEKQRIPFGGLKLEGFLVRCRVVGECRRKTTNPLRGTETRPARSAPVSVCRVEKQRIPFGGLKRVEQDQDVLDSLPQSRKTMNPLRGTETAQFLQAILPHSWIR